MLNKCILYRSSVRVDIVIVIEIVIILYSRVLELVLVALIIVAM